MKSICLILIYKHIYKSKDLNITYINYVSNILILTIHLDLIWYTRHFIVIQRIMTYYLIKNNYLDSIKILTDIPDIIMF
jgi:hypothetical protein